MFSSELEFGEKSRALKAATSRWLHDLANLVPNALARPNGPLIILQQSARGLRISNLSDGRLIQLGTLSGNDPAHAVAKLKTSLRSLDLENADIVLRLSPDNVLQREIRLPKAARDVLEPVIANQMDEMTPWPQADSVFGYRIAEPDNAEDQNSDHLTVNVVATSRKILDGVIATARTAGLKPRLIEYFAQGGSNEPIVIHGGDDEARSRMAQRIGRALSAFLLLVGTIGGLGLAGMLWQQFTLGSLQDEARQHQATLTSINRRDVPAMNLQRRYREIIDLKSAHPSILVTLEVLSRALPDTAWLTNLEVRGDELRIKGKADNAPDLIAQLEKLQYFENVQFAAPTTRADNERQEDFSISAKLLPVTNLE